MGEAPYDECEHKQQAHTGFNEMVALDRGEKSGCQDIGVKGGDKRITSVSSAGLNIGMAPACCKQSVKGRRRKKNKTGSKTAMEQS